jgi:arylsulfatase
MEVYAGFQENTDYQVGRVVQSIEDLGIADNTLIFYIWGDNGSSMEGTETGTFNEMTTITGVPLTPEQQLKLIDAYGGMDAWGGPVMQPHFSCAWAWAGNTPFQWGKQVASHLGGTRNPLVVSWPRRIKEKGLRSQFTHVIDVAPTILEVAGIPAPETVDGIAQMPIHGTSFAYSFADASAKSRHTQQYFEIFGNRAMYKDGWIACSRLDRIPWKTDPATVGRYAPNSGWDPDKEKWELYHLDEDFSEANEVAAQHPEKVAELKRLFWEDAKKYHVTPILASFAPFFGLGPRPPSQTVFTFYPGTQSIEPGMIPPVYNRSFTIAADLEIPARGAEGVIVANSDVMGGFALYVQEGKLRYTYSFLGIEVSTLAASEGLPSGKVRVQYEFTADEPGKPATSGRGRLLVNGKAVGENKLAHTVPSRFSSYAGMDIGRDNGDVVSPSYRAQAPFAFTGTIARVIFDVAPRRAP